MRLLRQSADRRAEIIAGFREAVKQKMSPAYVFIFASPAFFSCQAANRSV
jgi:hypothetical protein